MLANSSFIPGTCIQRAWDATSLSLLKECPFKYYLTMIEQWGPKRVSYHLFFGQIIHSALETYDHMRAQGRTHDEATREAVHHALKETWIDGKPWESGDSKKSRFTLVRAIVWYLETYSTDPCETVILANGKPAVELSFKLELGQLAPNGEPYLLCGHLDRLVHFGGTIRFLDRKTTGSALSELFFKQFSPHNQMSAYDMASSVIMGPQVRGGIIDGIECAVGFNRFGRSLISRTAAQRQEWLETTLIYIRQAETYATRNDWPQNDTACSHYLGCPFREVCSKDPAVRAEFLRADFTKKVWNPLQSREV